MVQDVWITAHFEQNWLEFNVNENIQINSKGYLLKRKWKERNKSDDKIKY